MVRAQGESLRQVRLCSSTGGADTWLTRWAEAPSSKAHSEYFDPCQEAADRSIRCLKRNGGERAMCSDFFQCVVSCSVRGNAGWDAEADVTPGPTETAKSNGYVAVTPRGPGRG